jgi:hypothetical protein
MRTVVWKAEGAGRRQLYMCTDLVAFYYDIVFEETMFMYVIDYWPSES